MTATIEKINKVLKGIKKKIVDKYNITTDDEFETLISNYKSGNPNFSIKEHSKANASENYMNFKRTLDNRKLLDSDESLDLLETIRVFITDSQNLYENSSRYN